MNDTVIPTRILARVFLLGASVILWTAQPAAAQNSASGCAQSADNKYAFKDLIELAKVHGATSSIPAKIGGPLGFGDKDLTVTRLSLTHFPTDTFRAIDLLDKEAGYVMFIRRKKDFVFGGWTARETLSALLSATPSNL